MSNRKPMMTVAAVASRLNCSTWTVRAMARDGRLQAIKLGGDGWRFEPDEVEATLRRWGKGGDGA